MEVKTTVIWLLVTIVTVVSACGSEAGGGLDDNQISANTAQGSAPETIRPVAPISGGCQPSDGDRGSTLGSGEHGLVVDGADRRYVLRVPSTYTPDQALPLLFALHPNGSDAGYFNKGDGGPADVAAAVDDEAIIVFAESVNGHWRDYEAPSHTWGDQIEEDLRYFDAVVAEITAQLCVDQESIYSLGFSGGGSFAGVLGCRRSYIRAFAAAGAVIYFDPAECAPTASAWVTIGVDELVPERTAFRDHFVNTNGCAAVTVVLEPADCVAYAGCASGRPVNYCQHGGGHVWPPYASTLAWSFLRSQ